MKTALVLAVLLAAVPAAAQPIVEVVPTCVEADAAQRTFLVRALERLELLIVETGCRDTITLTEEVEGDRVVVRLANSEAKRKMKVRATDDRIAIYTAMAKSLLAPPEPESEPTPAASPIEEYPTASTYRPELPQVDAVAPEDFVPMRSAFYAMLGVGTGVSMTLGYRTGHRTKFDLAWQIIGDDGPESGSKMTTVAMRAQIIRVAKPDARSTFYAGGGLSLASTERAMQYSSSPSAQEGGVRLESTLGFELGRSKSHVFYLEAAGALPLYNVGDTYPVTFVISAGAGM